MIEEVKMKKYETLYQSMSLACKNAIGGNGVQAIYAAGCIQNAKKLHGEMVELGWEEENGSLASVLVNLGAEVIQNDSK